jgi:hypothetical protein
LTALGATDSFEKSMPKRLRCAVYGAALGLAACDAEVYDHSRALGAPDARAQSENACREAAEGTSCDDRDICTPRSVCRAGACVGENPFDTCIVADTVDDFTETQGGNGWWYGYWDASNDADGYDPQTDFQPMEYCRLNTWLPAGRCEASPEWTQNLSHGLQHAETDPYLELPVRRWISDVSGPARIFAEHYINGGNGGDGTRAMLLLDGVEIWRNAALPHGTPGQTTLDVDLELGTIVEQLLHPRGGQAEDMTYFSITVSP